MPLPYKRVEGPLAERIHSRDNPAMSSDSYILYGDRHFYCSGRFVEFADEIENFSVKDDDVWVISTPKAGVLLLIFKQKLFSLGKFI